MIGGRGSVRTQVFVLALVALAIAEAIGITLIQLTPPVRNAPLSVRSVVAMLQGPATSQAVGHAGGIPGQERIEYQVQLVDRTPPPPPDLDADGAAAVRLAVAAVGGFAATDVVVHVRRGHLLPPRPGEPPDAFGLGEGFYVATRLADGRFQAVSSVVEPFPNAFERQVLLLLLIGGGLLLPLAWLFARTLSQPLQEFAAAAARVGADPHAATLPASGPAEVRQLATAFNAMQARIQRLLEERTEMIGAIAHDLRTPLTRLVFRLGDLPEDLQRKALADVDEMKSMITRTLEFTRDRAASVLRDPLDFRLLVEAVVDNYADTGAPVSLEAGGAVTITGDPAVLRRAIGNVIDNALKYGQVARLALRVTATQVELVVDDDGPGIPEALQARALRPFTRLETSRSRETGGVGLGLTVARSAALDHGGELTLANRAGGGLRVTFLLPRVAVQGRGADGHGPAVR